MYALISGATYWLDSAFVEEDLCVCSWIISMSFTQPNIPSYLDFTVRDKFQDIIKWAQLYFRLAGTPAWYIGQARVWLPTEVLYLYTEYTENLHLFCM